MPAPRWLARLNRRLTNPVLGRLAPHLPGFGVVVHTGRISRRVYRTPVNVFRRGPTYVIALTYGANSEWVRNVLANGSCGLFVRGRLVRLRQPRLFRDPSRRLMPPPVRVVLGLLGVSEFLELRLDSPPLYAVVRDNKYDPRNLAQGQRALDEFQALHDRQTGSLGTLVVDAGNDRWITINVWESQEQAMAALPGLIPEVQRLIEPLLAAPSQLIVAGPVRLDTLLDRLPARR
jgi:deazaflavin-dependent oxidoreductase (nitroreductase family)